MKLGCLPFLPLVAKRNAFVSNTKSGKYSDIELPREWLELMWCVPKNAVAAKLQFYSESRRNRLALRGSDYDSPYYCRIEYPSGGWKETYLGEKLGTLVQEMLASVKTKVIYIECVWRVL